MNRVSMIAAGLVYCVHAWAQANTGNLQGTISDASGARIPSATVVVTSAQGQPRKAVATGEGVYRFVGLPIGDYQGVVESPGFKRLAFSVTILSGQTQTLDWTLAVGDVAETVTVEASAAVLNTQSSSAQALVYRGRAARSVKIQPNTEDYGIVNDTGFAGVKTKPLSTFSIDVDTASYSNMRRFLQQGQLPPKDAVRIEEMLNFFRYDYPDPSGEHPFSVTTELAACPWNAKHQLVHIGLKSKSIAAESLPPANLTFLIDVSGSMTDENKLPLVQKSFRLLVEQLRQQDRVAIVVYAGAAGLVLPPTSGAEKDKILAALDRLQAGGSTAGSAGIKLAYETAHKSFDSKGNNRVILATDGDFNVGASSDGELIRMIEQEREGGVFLTVLGYGYGNLKDAKLEALSRHGNGNYAYIDSMLEARRVLVQQMGATLLTVAKDVKLQVEFNPATVKSYRLIGYENRRLNDEDFKNDKKDAGELGAGHSVTAIYEIVPTASLEAISEIELKYQQRRNRPSREALTVKLRYKPQKASRSVEFEQALEYRLAAEPSANFRFAMGVCEFGLILHESKYKADANYDSAIANAQSAVGVDPDGQRSEFVFLAKTARKLAATSISKR